MKVRYEGVHPDHQKKYLDAYYAQLDPPEKPATPSWYHVEKDDPPHIVERKKADTQKWKDEQLAERKKEIDCADAAKEICWRTDKPGVTFTKGAVVDLDDEHPLLWTVDPTGKKFEGPLHGHIKAGVFTVLEQAKPSPAAEALEAEKAADKARLKAEIFAELKEAGLLALPATVPADKPAADAGAKDPKKPKKD